MLVSVRWGDPMFPESHKNVVINTLLRDDTQGMQWLHLKLKYHPHAVKAGAGLTDGLNIYTIIDHSGPRFVVGDIYTSDNPERCLPVQIQGATKFLWMRFYKAEIGYRGETKTLWKSEKSLVNHLKGYWWLSWLP